MKAGTKMILAGAGLFVLGVALVPGVVLWLLFGSAPGDTVRFQVPGTRRVSVTVPGRYYLWNDFETEWGGNRYRDSERIVEDLQIAIWRVDNDRLYDFVPDTSLSTRSGREARNSIGYVEVERPGKVAILVAGVQPRIFSFSQTRIFDMFRRLSGAIALALALGLSGAGLVIWGIIRSVQAAPTKAPAVSAEVPTFRPEVLPPEDAPEDRGAGDSGQPRRHKDHEG